MPSELDPRFLLSVLLRRFPVFLLTAVVIFSGFAAAAVLIPASYRSSAKILVESQQIPTALVLALLVWRLHWLTDLPLVHQIQAAPATQRLGGSLRCSQWL